MTTFFMILWLLSLSAAFLCGWIFCAAFSATAIGDLSDQIAEMKRDRDWQAARRAREEHIWQTAPAPLPFVPFTTKSR